MLKTVSRVILTNILKRYGFQVVRDHVYAHQQEQLNDALKMVEGTRKDVDRKDSEITRLKNEFIEQISSTEKIFSNLSRAQESLGELDGKLVLADEKVSELEAKVSETEAAHQAELSQKGLELQAAQESLGELDGKLVLADERTSLKREQLSKLRKEHAAILGDFSSSLVELKSSKKILLDLLSEDEPTLYKNLFVSLLPFSKKKDFFELLSSNTKLKEQKVNLNLFPGDQANLSKFSERPGSFGYGYLSATVINPALADIDDTALVILISNPIHLASEALQYLLTPDEIDEDTNFQNFHVQKNLDRDEILKLIKNDFMKEVSRWFLDWYNYLSKKPNKEIFLLKENEQISTNFLRLLKKVEPTMTPKNLYFNLDKMGSLYSLTSDESKQIKDLFPDKVIEFFDLDFGS